MAKAISTCALIVITDANVLTNFIHIGRLDLPGGLAAHRFAVPEEVIQEVDDPGHARALCAALEAKHLERLTINQSDTLALFAQLRTSMGKGEAACLAVAARHGHAVASDEKRRFRRMAIELLGEGRLLRTEDLILQAIRGGQISVGEADAFKSRLAERRYAMNFPSFAQLVA
ncbi:hypothetical protein CDN99_16215 [Roseateles aquatilis]|uniref:PIN domain-containing protein n=1 Tax=Roseateles aquatilis TaxID=431061 RepID=A0A246J6Z0_9BURK|nr:hypothetical protein [Roseateles aquatilis]OWQ88403.1 hypothetical protein CDN99_16215 [Roseateles aquatilis]